MILAAMFLSATVAAVPREIETFVGHLKAARMADAYSLLSAGAREHVRRTQFDAYIASRRRALGSITGIANVRLSDHKDKEKNITVYEADVRFDKGTAPSGFMMAREGTAWRIERFVISMPDGVTAKPDASEVPPFANELMTMAKSQNLAALVDQLSEEDLARAQQTSEAALATFTMIDELLGHMRTFTLGKPEDADTDCMRVEGNAAFEHGKAPVKLVLCWSDGIWRLRYAEVTPLIDPHLLERSIAHMFKGTVTAECPSGADFPVGGKIVCRVTERGGASKDATVLRTTLSGWKIIAVDAAKK